MWSAFFALVIVGTGSSSRQIIELKPEVEASLDWLAEVPFLKDPLLS
jgi:hypothetical protein